jgi:hypothetical protein
MRKLIYLIVLMGILATPVTVLAKEISKQTFMEKIEVTIELLDKWDEYNVFSSLTTHKDIMLVTSLFTAYAIMINKSKQYDLNKDEKNKVQDFKKKAIARQLVQFPKIRHAFNPIANQSMKRHNISVETFGRRSVIIQFVGNLFRKYIDEEIFQDVMLSDLRIMRFKQSRYKQNNDQNRYVNYTIHSPDDSRLIIWRDEYVFDITDN